MDPCSCRHLTLIFYLFLHFFRAIWLLGEVQACQTSLVWSRAEPDKTVTITDGPSTTSTLFGPEPHGSSSRCSYTRVTCRPSKSRGGCQGKLYLTSTLPDSLHSTQARHSSLGGCNPPSPGLTNDSKNRKSER